MSFPSFLSYYEDFKQVLRFTDSLKNKNSSFRYLLAESMLRYRGGMT
ncbi:hypothetical protein OZD61_00730 [Wolbachia endosymbiont of Drosophila bocki]|nr:hypothetical protein [Wolbachia endosymbiont of Drosophila bocki]